MACFHPIDAWQPLEGDRKLRFREVRDARYLQIPCGRCIGCRLVRKRTWAIRCMHEAQMHSVSSFVTLTYERTGPSLVPLDFTRFMYRVRERLGPTRFFACGEYGELNLRPHFHALLFGQTFPDGKPCGDNICSSGVLSKLWPFGFASFGSVTYDSAAYVAGYTCKKVSGDKAVSHYSRVDVETGEIVECVPEFGRMSLRPGIGYPWFVKYWRDVYVARDGVVREGGNVVPPPRIYDKWLSELGEEGAWKMESLKFGDRPLRGRGYRGDSTSARLEVRERCALAKERFLKRSKL